MASLLKEHWCLQCHHRCALFGLGFVCVCHARKRHFPLAFLVMLTGVSSILAAVPCKCKDGMFTL